MMLLARGTLEVAKFIASLKTTSIIGGGGYGCGNRQFNLEDKMSHISTGEAQAWSF